MIITFCGLCPHPTSGIGAEISGNNINAEGIDKAQDNLSELIKVSKYQAK